MPNLGICLDNATFVSRWRIVCFITSIPTKDCSSVCDTSTAVFGAAALLRVLVLVLATLLLLEVLQLSVFLFKWEISFAASRTARTHAHLSRCQRYELV